VRIVVINHVTFDGVMQGPGRPDEDTRDGFAHGGWASAGQDPAITDAIGERMAPPGGGMLLGRRSYEDMLGAWNERGGPFKEALNAASKYVVSHSPDTELKWPASTLLSGAVPGLVAALKGQEGGNLVIMGSGELIRSLLPHGLIDEFLLIVYPLVLGSGRRLFEHDAPRLELELADSKACPSGAIIATYHPIPTEETRGPV
jgi:dihydrofolate reductase